ncbi:MAG: tol-pal system protein YbgF [Sphingomonadales bacterium]|jgi:tol-pal system protein YbgF
MNKADMGAFKVESAAMMRRHIHKFWLIPFVFLGLVFLGTANAQSNDVRALERKVDVLERQLQAVQRKVFQGGDSRFFPENKQGGISQQPLDAPQSSGNLLADLEVRVAALENRLRQLTGQIEETGFKTNQLREEFDKFRDETNFLLKEMEGSSAEGAAQVDAPQKDILATNDVPSAPALIPSRPEETDPQAVFDKAFKLMSQGEYGQAESAFNAFLEEHRQHQLASNAQYWLGRTYLVQKNYPKAAAAFFAGHTDYPDGAKAPHSLLGLGTALFELGQKEEACAALDLLRRDYPDAPQDIQQRSAAERTRMSCS